MTRPTTVGELRESGYRPRSVKEEMRANLIRKIASGEEIFPGIVGYEETVLPQIENAVLSGQDIIFLGERGQAKTRIARALINLLDEEVPVLVMGEGEARELGVRQSFADVGATVAGWFGVEGVSVGRSMLEEGEMLAADRMHAQRKGAA